MENEMNDELDLKYVNLIETIAANSADSSKDVDEKYEGSTTLNEKFKNLIFNELDIVSHPKKDDLFSFARVWGLAAARHEKNVYETTKTASWNTLTMCRVLKTKFL